MPPHLHRSTGTLLAALTVLLAGCTGAVDTGDDGTTGGNAGNGPGSASTVTAEVPWWHVGDYWTLTYKVGERETQTVRLVVFLNDSGEIDPDHFWLGVPDRAQALDHALYDTNPFLGRIHWRILAPHEKGMHTVMYQFPLVDGKTWTGKLLGGEWEVRVEADPSRPGAFEITGTGVDGRTIAYDYDPDLKWFTHLAIQGTGGQTDLKATLDDHGTGATGTYHFIRGRDYYAGPRLKSGSHGEEFTVRDEGVTALAFRVDLTVTSPLEIQLVNPDGRIVQREASTGGKLDRTFEIPYPAPGTWEVRYVTAGEIQGTVLGTGLIEYKRTI